MNTKKTNSDTAKKNHKGKLTETSKFRMTSSGSNEKIKTHQPNAEEKKRKK